MRVDVSSQDTHATVSPVGEIDLATVSLLTSTLTDTLQAGAQHVTVDLTHVTYIDSAGLGALVGAHKRLRAAGGSLVIRCQQPRVLRLLTITGLTKLFTIVETAQPTAPPPLSVSDAAVG
jgi:anti-sigma B factor antagonist